MGSLTVKASALRYAVESSSSWSSGKARQGVYGSKRYVGALQFSGLSALPNNFTINAIKLTATFGPAGVAHDPKNLTFYKATKNDISGTGTAMLGDPLGVVTLSDAYDRTVTLSFDSSNNATVFAAMKTYFTARNQTQLIYVPTTRQMRGSFCADYLSITAATLVVDYDEIQATYSLSSTTVMAGSSITIYASDVSRSLNYRATWRFGTLTETSAVTPTTSNLTKQIPLSWLNQIPSSSSAQGSVTIETQKPPSNEKVNETTLYFTVTVPQSGGITIGSVSVAPVNTNSVLKQYSLYAYRETAASITVSGCASSTGAKISSCSITTQPNVGSRTFTTGSASYSFTTDKMTSSGTITVNVRVTDSRGTSATSSKTFYVYPYSAPSLTSVNAYRCLSNGDRNELNGNYAYVTGKYTYSTVSNINSASCTVTLSQVGGSSLGSSSLSSGSAQIMGSGRLVTDATYTATFTLRDTIGGTATHSITIPSAAYLIHFAKGGKAIGIGCAAGETNTISMGWALKLNSPLGVAYGGTGSTTASGACAAIGALSATGKAASATKADSATTATKLATARTISLSGDVTASGSFDGSSNLAMRATLATKTKIDYRLNQVIDTGNTWIDGKNIKCVVLSITSDTTDISKYNISSVVSIRPILQYQYNGAGIYWASSYAKPTTTASQATRDYYRVYINGTNLISDRGTYVNKVLEYVILEFTQST